MRHRQQSVTIVNAGGCKPASPDECLPDGSIPSLSSPHCIAAFVRHGDKDREMTLVPWSTYADAITTIWRRAWAGNQAWASATGPRPYVMLGTDDPAVIEEASAWATANGWELRFTTMVDRRLTYKVRDTHPPLEYVSMLLNLEMSVQCEAFVCTEPSNTCQLMDELRASAGARANRAWADVAPHTCGRPPCVRQGGNWARGDGDEEHI